MYNERIIRCFRGQISNQRKSHWEFLITRVDQKRVDKRDSRVSTCKKRFWSFG